MMYTLSTDVRHSKEWGLNSAEGHVFCFLHQVPSWAKTELLDGEIYYHASRNKAIEETAIVTDKPDTMYRFYKSLEQKGVINYRKHKGRDLIRITEKGRLWNTGNSEKNPNPETDEQKLGKKSESGDSFSEKNPNPDSEKNPTYNNTSTSNNYTSIDNEVPAEKSAGSQKTPKLNWSKESYRIFDQVQEHETGAAGLNYIGFDWKVNSEENAKQMKNLRLTLIRGMNAKLNLPADTEPAFTDYAAALELYLRWAWRYYRKQQELTGVINYTPTACYRDFNKIKTYAASNKNRTRSAASESSPFFQGFGG